MSSRRATAFAPATVGNAAVGFDVLGFAVDAVGDRVTVTRGAPGVRVVDIRGVVTDLPRDPAANTAAVGLLQLYDELQLDWGFDVELDKGIALGSGMGGSAASAVAAVVAANALLDEPLSNERLFPLALAGEAVASGAAHPDNAAPCLLGGIVLVAGEQLISLPAPALWVTLVHPHMRLDTRRAREVIPQNLPLKTFVEQSANLAAFVDACHRGDAAGAAVHCRDLMIEPFRSPLIPGFDAARDAAYEAGAATFSISGSGPTVFALSHSRDDAEACSAAIVEAFGVHHPATDAWVCRFGAPGARVESSE